MLALNAPPCAICRLSEAQKYHEECCEIAERNGLDYEGSAPNTKKGVAATGSAIASGLYISSAQKSKL